MADTPSYEPAGGGGEELVEIGNFIRLDQRIDQQSRVTNYVRNNLAVVDLLPVDYTLTLGNIGDKNKWATEYKFDEAQAAFKGTCSKYGLKEYTGVRMWITDDTTAVDDISSDFELNIIEKGLNSVAGLSKKVEGFRKLVMSAGSNYAGHFKELAGSKSQDADAVSSAADTAAGIIIEGKKIALPKIWSSSRYDPSLSLNLKLVSPYGDPEAIKTYIVEPLTYLLVLASPKTNDGLSYGLVKPIKVTAYGISNMNLAFIRNVNIRRGGRESSYNKHRQPLVLDISITISPLTDGFAAVEKGKNDIGKVSDVTSAKRIPITSGPAVTTVGNIINSFIPAPKDLVLPEGSTGGKPMGGRKSTPTSIITGLSGIA